jgi:maltose O-acetyltransferase
MKLLGIIYKSLILVNNLIYRLTIMKLIKLSLSKCGKNVTIMQRTNLSFSNISIGNNVYIGPNACFLSAKAKIIIGNDVLFGPNVTIITGDHRYDLPGRTMFSINNTEKLSSNDQNVVFEGDNWIGANSTILKGVIIGYGSIIGAGSVVTHSIPKNTVFAGVPARFIKNRFGDS